MSSEKSPSFSDHHASSNSLAPQTAYPRGRPLVDYCTNEWRSNPEFASPARSSSIDTPLHEDFYDRLEDWIDGCFTVIKAPRFRRLILVLVIFVTTTIFLWVKIIGPWIVEERAAWASLEDDSARASGGLFGSNVRPHFPGMIHFAQMDPKHLPDSNDRRKRLIFVGDIHGCKKELLALMDKVGFNPDTDHLVAVGDVVNKGPDTPGVIDFLRANHASCVRGNHEDTLLLTANSVKSSALRASNGEGHQVGEPFENDPVTKLAHELTHDQLTWLRDLPVILKIGNVKGLGDIVVVHGGLVPGVPLDAQDPVSVMNMRTIDLKTHVPSRFHEQHGSIPWFRLWNRYQQLLPSHPRWRDLFGKKGHKKDKHTLVVYGHDAKKGLQIGQYTKGLDSSCVRGGQLTALAISGSGKQQIVQVNCPGYTKPKSKQRILDDILRPAGG